MERRRVVVRVPLEVLAERLGVRASADEFVLAVVPDAASDSVDLVVEAPWADPMPSGLEGQRMHPQSLPGWRRVVVFDEPERRVRGDFWLRVSDDGSELTGVPGSIDDGELAARAAGVMQDLARWSMLKTREAIAELEADDEDGDDEG